MSTAVIERPAFDPVRGLTKEMEAKRVLLEQMRELAAGDEEFLTDLVEGETGIFEIISKIDESELEDQTIMAGLDVTIKRLQERKRKAEKRSETKRALIASALSQIGLRTHKTALGTITVSDKAPVAIVIEEADIPAKFWEAQPPKLDKKALNEALRARRAATVEAFMLKDTEERTAALVAADKQFPQIPGATLSNGGVTLTIRR